LDAGVVLDPSGEWLDHFWFEVEESDHHQEFRGFRVVRLLELRSIPLDARADSGLLQKMRTVLRSLYGGRISLVYLAGASFTPPAVGIRQCYGVSVSAAVLADAQHQSSLAVHALRSAMTGSFRQLKLESLSAEAGEWVLSSLQNSRHALVVVGQPDPRENSRGGSTALFRNPVVEGSSNSQEYSLQQNEILFRGMSTLKEEFLLLVMTSPIPLEEISRMLISLAEYTSTWASWQSGIRGVSFGISLPAILSGALMEANAHSSGVSEAVSESLGTSHTEGQSEMTGSAHSEGQAQTSGWSHTIAHGLAVTDSVSSTEGHSVTDGSAHSEGSAISMGTMQTSAASGGQTSTIGSSDSLGGSVSTGADLGINAGVDAGVSAGASTNFGHTDSVGQAASSGWSTSEGISQSETASTLDTVSHAETLSQASTVGHAVTQSVVESYGSSGAVTQSSSDTTSQSQGSSSADGTSQSTSLVNGSSSAMTASQGSTHGLAFGVAPSLSMHQSNQWQFDPAILITQILRAQQHLLELASKEGAFICDTYALARTEQGRQALLGLIPESFHGSEDVVTGVQTRCLTPDEEGYILAHARAFSPSNREETLPEVLSGYMDSTLLTLLQVAAYTAPGMFEMGTATTVQESTPDFAYYPQMPGDVFLARQWASELGEITQAPLRLTPSRHFHTAFCGDTGFGKSVSAERLAYETTLKWHYRSIVLDFGQGWRRALNWERLDGRVDVRQVFPGAERPLRWNLLQVPRRMDPGRYRSMLAELFCNAGQMGARQLGFLRRALTDVYQKWGVLLCSEKEGFYFIQNSLEAALVQKMRTASGQTAAQIAVGYPLVRLSHAERQVLAVERSKRASISEVIQRLREIRNELGRSDQTSRTSLEGLLLRVEVFEEGAMAHQYGPGADSLGIEDLGLLGPAADPWGLVVIEGGAEMSDAFAKSAILSLLASVLYFDAVTRRRESLAGVRFPPMQIFFEEANKILSGISTGSVSSEGPGSRGSGVSEIFQTMWRDGRKYGIFLHPVVQTISDLPDGILASCNNIFIVQTKNPRDRDMVIAHIGRSEKGFVNTEYKRYLARIPVRMAVVKLGYHEDVTQLEPMLVSTLRVPGEEPSDHEILARLGTA
jgi:hypothetical protein